MYSQLLHEKWNLLLQRVAYSLCLSCMKAFTEKIWQEHVQLMRSNSCNIKFRLCFLLGFIYQYSICIQSFHISYPMHSSVDGAPFLISQPIVTLCWVCKLLVNIKVTAINLTLLLEENLRWEIWQEMTGIFLGLAQKKVEVTLQREASGSRYLQIKWLTLSIESFDSSV